MPRHSDTSFCLLLAVASLVGCAPEATRKNLDCTAQVGSACAVSIDGGGEIRWELSNIQPGEEYMIGVFAADDENHLRTLSHNVEIESDVASAPLSDSEKKDLDRVIARDRRNTTTNNADDPYPRSQETFNFAPRRAQVYVPDPNDYIARFEDGSTQRRYRAPSGIFNGNLVNSISDIGKVDGVYDLFVNDKLIKTGTGSQALTSNFDSWKQQKFSELNLCLNRVMPNTIQKLGNSYDIDGSRDVKIFLTDFEGGSSQNTIGLFNFRDRFNREGADILKDSNNSEIIYLQPLVKSLSSDRETLASKLCSTTAHEFTHLISFDSKVLANLPDNKRQDLNEANKRGLFGEWISLDEGYAAHIEQLTGEVHSVSERMYRYMKNPSGATLSSRDDDESRGFAITLLARVLKRLGGTFGQNDPQTLKVLKELVRSNQIGLNNIASYLGETPEETLKDYVQNFSMSLFDKKVASDFLPRVERTTVNFAQSSLSVPRGIEIQPRETKVEQIKFQAPSFHPLQANIPLLAPTQRMNMNPQDLNFFRFIMPQNSDRKSTVVFSSSKVALKVFLVRVR